MRILMMKKILKNLSRMLDQNNLQTKIYHGVRLLVKKP